MAAHKPAMPAPTTMTFSGIDEGDYLECASQTRYISTASSKITLLSESSHTPEKTENKTKEKIGDPQTAGFPFFLYRTFQAATPPRKHGNARRVAVRHRTSCPSVTERFLLALAHLSSPNHCPSRSTSAFKSTHPRRYSPSRKHRVSRYRGKQTAKQHANRRSAVPRCSLEHRG